LAHLLQLQILIVRLLPLVLVKSLCSFARSQMECQVVLNLT
jgi:hypothetical protein